MKESNFSMSGLMFTALIDGYSLYTDDALQIEREKLTAEKRLTEMKLNALEAAQCKKRVQADANETYMQTML